MHHIKTGKLRKHMSAMMAVIMAVSLAVPAGLSFSARTVSAADKTVEAKAGETIYNLRDGSIIATDTDGKKDVTYDRLTVKVGTKNAYKYNGPDHGVAFKDCRWFIYRNKGCQNCFVLSSGWYNYRFCIYR